MGTDLLSFLMAMAPGPENILTNPWVHVALIAVPCFVFVVSRRYNMLVAFLSIPASICILRYTTEGISVPDCYADKLPVFVGGFLVIAAINLYYHLVKH